MNGKSKSKRIKNHRAKNTKRPHYRPRGTFITGKVKRIGNEAPKFQGSADVFARTWFTTLKYAESSFISPPYSTGLSQVGYTYNANCVSDPRYDLGGAQPLWYDQIAPHYERVWVHAVEVDLTFSNPTVDGFYVGYRCRPATNNRTTAGQALDYIQQMDLTEIKPLNNTGSQTVKFKFFIKNHDIFNLTKAQYQNNSYSHVTTGIPSVFSFIEPWAIATAAEGSVRYDIKIKYFCEFTNRITPLQSF